MSDITHQKARSLIQTAADQALKSDEHSALDLHLQKCNECSEYAHQLFTLEQRLRSAFHARWDISQSTTLNAQSIINPTPAKLMRDNFFGQTGAMGKAVIVTALLLGYFVIANVFGIQSPIVVDETTTTLPTPNESISAYNFSHTPSAPVTLTDSTTQVCETYIYTALENDTLASIALQHGTTQEEILEYNHLSSNTVLTGMELIIPLCNNTPSHTATIPANTTTITPINRTIFPTQPQ